MAEVQTFEQIYGLTRGGPGSATKTLALYAFERFFQQLRYGYGSAVNLVLLLVTIVRGRSDDPSKAPSAIANHRGSGFPGPLYGIYLIQDSRRGEQNTAAYSPGSCIVRGRSDDPSTLCAELCKKLWLTLRNTLLLAGGSGLGATVLGAMAAYAFSRGTSAARRLYSLLVASMAVPAMVTLGPNLSLICNLLDTQLD